MKRVIRGARTLSRAAIPLSALALLLAVGVPCSAQQEGGLIVRAHDDEVLVEGVEPSSQVVLMGVIRRVFGTIPGLERWIGTAWDDDGDGSITVTLESAVRPNRSAWVVVDVETMGWAMSQPIVGGSPLALPTEATLPAGERDWTIETGNVDVLVMRPGDGIVGPGIWAGSASDGGPLDADGTHNGSVTVQAKDLEEVPGSSGPAPLTFEAGDLLVAFHPEVFSSFVASVTEGGGE